MAKSGRGPSNRRNPAAGGKASGSGKRSRKPVVVNPNSGGGVFMVSLYVIVGLVVVALLGYTGYQVYVKNRSITDRALDINGVSYYNEDDQLGRDHVDGDQTYSQVPPVGGNHNGNWETCNGVVYTEQIPDEHAVHSLEHGAVWITYSPTLPADQIATLATKVEGQDYTLMSPHPDQTAPISLQAWGYQLTVEDASDPRIDEFIELLRVNASVEPGATCSGGTSATGSVPEGTTPPVDAPSGDASASEDTTG